jgi:hypothetical protein
MTNGSQHTAAILLIVVPTIEYGGYSLLRAINRNEPGYLDNPVRRMLFRAGHAHAGVWLIFALVALLYLDKANLSGGWQAVVSTGFTAGPILMPLGFFLSVASPRASRPNKIIWLVYAGAAALAIATVTLGIGLLR